MLKPLFKYADFNGRANRAEYWLFGLFQVLLYIGIMAFSAALAASGSLGAAIGTGLLLFVVVALGCFIPNLAVAVRRLHDSNKSAWWLLLYLPSFLVGFATIGEVVNLSRSMGENSLSSNPEAIANMAASAPHISMLSMAGNLCQLLLFIFMVWPGTRGPNRFGDDPRGGGLDLTVFDAPEDMAPLEPAEAPQKPPHKPIFDFTSPEPAPAQVAAPAPVRPIVQPTAPVRQTPVFGKRR
ncbi:MAG TPA: DUF805 domain-containing protein [Asticcacaulis sp.]|nr:DUF805 domain-containing protein [Asticcacaulis sp.]